MSSKETQASTTLVGLSNLALTSEQHVAPHTIVESRDEDLDVPLGEFLARPRYIGVVSWANAAAYDSNPASFSILTSLLSSTNVMNKLRGHSAMRCTLHVRLQCAGSPYFLGGLAVGWRPTGGGSVNNTMVTEIPRLHPAQLLQMPAACLIDPGRRENVDLSLPFVHCNGRYDLYTPQQYDVLTFGVLNKINSTSAEVATCTITVHAWMTDVELFGATYQSEMQGSVARVKPTGARIMRGFASAFARRAADSALTSLGLGAPGDTTLTATYPHTAAVLTSNGARPTSMLATHALVEQPVDSVSGKNETNIRSICSREGWISRISWAAGGAASQLAYFPVNPLHIAGAQTMGTTNTRTCYLYTPLGYTSMAFALWRGTIRFRLDVRANKFCTGTLRIRFDPRGYATPSYTADIADTHCAYLDISTGNSVTLDCPFVALRPWLECNRASDTSNASSNGMVIIDYIEPLKSNGVAVEINVFVSCPDVEFASPAEDGVWAGLSYNVSTTPAIAPTYQSHLNDQYYDVRDFIKLPRMNWGWIPTGAAVARQCITLPDAPVSWPLATNNQPTDWYYANNPLHHFSGLFLARTGGLRYVVFYSLIGAAGASDTIREARYMAAKRNPSETVTSQWYPFYRQTGGGGPASISGDQYGAGSIVVMDAEAISVTYDSPDTANSEWTLATGLSAKFDGTNYTNRVWWASQVPVIKHSFFATGDEASTVGITVLIAGADDANLAYFICVPWVFQLSTDAS